ncbi:uncharacterized protein [Palaemon carinicauda]|uniref:uncharacterized protein n=1 Tax=Palaemon carinicauda TaxID=392227 RepID=UPI0035B657F1
MRAFMKLLFTAALLDVFIEANPAENQHHGSCKPRTMYIQWQKVRNYLNKNFEAAIPGTMLGGALRVKRCRSFLSPCNLATKTFCGVNTEKRKRQKLRVINERHEKWILTLDFVEDESCRCMELNEYIKFIPGDVADTPYIFRITWAQKSEGKKIRRRRRNRKGKMRLSLAARMA